MGSRIVDVEERKIAGLKVAVRKKKGEGDLSKHWIDFIGILERTGEIKNLKECYGYCKNYKDDGDYDSFDYIMAMDRDAYTDIPKEFVEETIPGGRYAAYTYRGRIEPDRLKDFIQNIYTVELARDGFVPIRYESIEYYGSKYKHGEDDSKFEMWIPIG